VDAQRQLAAPHRQNKFGSSRGWIGRDDQNVFRCWLDFDRLKQVMLLASESSLREWELLAGPATSLTQFSKRCRIRFDRIARRRARAGHWSPFWVRSVIRWPTGDCLEFPLIWRKWPKPKPITFGRLFGRLLHTNGYFAPTAHPSEAQNVIFQCWLVGTLAHRHVAVLRITPLFMGAESCEKSESLQTFFATFVMYALYGSKKLRKKFWNFHFRQ